MIWYLEADPNNPYTLYATSGYLANSQTGNAGKRIYHPYNQKSNFRATNNVGFESGQHIHTLDGGLTWINETYDLPNLPVNYIVHNDSSLINTF